MEHHLTEPFTTDKYKDFKVGDKVYITGHIYAARDAAHRRLVEKIDAGEEPPIDLRNAIIYYMGPTPARPGKASGSAGPTTSYRMDPYTPQLIAQGVSATIGKGSRSEAVKTACQEKGAVYFAAIGGTAALIAQSIEDSGIVAFEDMDDNAIYLLKVSNMPVIVALDQSGSDIYKR